MNKRIVAVFIALLFIWTGMGESAQRKRTSTKSRYTVKKVKKAPKIGKKRKHGRPAFRRRRRHVRPVPINLNCIANPERFTAGLLADGDNGQVFFLKNIDDIRPIASLTKLMLAMVVIDRVNAGLLNWDDRAFVSANATARSGTRLRMRAGDLVTIDDLMKGAMVLSANDAAYALAEHIGGGDIQGCIRLMNEKARLLGLFDTVFYNPDGLPPIPSDSGLENVSTAKELFIMAREALKYPEILHYSSITHDSILDGKRSITSSNKLLLHSYPGLDGLKTGFYRRAGFNIIATAKRGERRLIAIVLGASNNSERFNEAAGLLNMGFSEIAAAPPARPGAASYAH